MDENSVRPRRWRFNFGLRTLFVVLTGVSLWLGWHFKIVNERREAIARFPVGDRKRAFAAICVDCHPGAANRVPSHFRRWASDPERLGLDLGSVTEFPKLSVFRRWMGDEPFSAIVAPVTYSDSEMERLCRLFPETLYLARFNEGPKKKVDVFRDLGLEPHNTAYFVTAWLRLLLWPAIVSGLIGAWLLVPLLRTTRSRAALGELPG